MNQLIWHFGFAVENSLSETEKQGYLFQNDQVSLANEYAEDAMKHIQRLLTGKQRSTKKRQSIVKWLKKVLDINALFTDESHPQEFTDDAVRKLTLLFRGHYLELQHEKWFRNYINSPSNNVLASRYFDYDTWNNMKEQWRKKLLIATGTVICPYCDRQYITAFDNRIGKTKRTLATLDHFFTKSKYPLFALSLFNFIPACYGCNSVIRAEKQLSIYPYKIGFDKLTHFSLKPAHKKAAGETIENVVDWILGKNVPQFTITQTINEELPQGFSETDINNDIKTLNLDEVYAIHTEYVQDLLQIRRFYENPDYLAFVENLLKSSCFTDDLKYPVTVNKLRLFLIGDDWINENEDTIFPQNRPLAKLTSAVLKDELDILFE